MGISIPGTHNSPTNLRLPDEKGVVQKVEKQREPGPDEVMTEALRGDGWLGDMTVPTRIWKVLLPVIEQMEREHIDTMGRVDEGAIMTAVKMIAQSILARSRFAASLKAKRKHRSKKR